MEMDVIKEEEPQWIVFSIAKFLRQGNNNIRRCIESIGRSWSEWGSSSAIYRRSALRIIKKIFNGVYRGNHETWKSVDACDPSPSQIGILNWIWQATTTAPRLWLLTFLVH